MKWNGNIIKNVMGVTVPKSGGIKGIDMATVVGVVGKIVKDGGILIEQEEVNAEKTKYVNKLRMSVKGKY